MQKSPQRRRQMQQRFSHPSPGSGTPPREGLGARDHAAWRTTGAGTAEGAYNARRLPPTDETTMESHALSKVMLVEDDQKLARLMSQYLSEHGFEVRQVHRGDTALDNFVDFRPQAVMLDLMLPGQSGLHVCREIRRIADTPILMLTAKESDLDHILGLESGADDYVIKPIEPPVLLARLRALLRRHAPAGGERDSLEFGRLNIDRRRRGAELGGQDIELTTMEFELLWLLAGQAGEILSRDEILNRTRGIGFDGLNRSVDVCISKLRAKLQDNPREPVRIKTVWGKGYLFNPLGWES